MTRPRTIDHEAVTRAVRDEGLTCRETADRLGLKYWAVTKITREAQARKVVRRRPRQWWHRY